jgi:hypothetical protein
MMVARYPLHPKNPTPRTVGDTGKIKLDRARKNARAWLALIEKGKDPKIEEERARAAAQRQHNNVFAAVAAEFLDRHAKRLRKSAEAKRAVS